MSSQSKETAPKEETESEFSVGIVVTCLYFVCYIVYFWLSGNSLFDLQTEQFASFLAGFFSPLAFIWLVFGYRQQSQDLKSQSRQLRLAVDEYRGQNALTATQLRRYRPSFDIQMIERAYDMEWSRSRPDQVRFKFLLQNTGGDAKGVCVGLYRAPVVRQTYTMRASFPSGFKDTEYIVHAHCRDVDIGSHMYITITGWDALDRYFRFDFRTNHSEFKPSDMTSNGFPMHRVIISDTHEENISGYHSDMPKVSALTGMLVE